jgi:carboxypeptidase Taq
MSPTPAYDALVAHHRQLHHLEHAQAILTWDRLTQMPKAAAPARAQAQAAFALVMKQVQEEPRLAQWLAAAEGESLAGDAALNLALMNRTICLERALPPSLVQRRELATSAAMQAWGRARQDNDWAAFAPAWITVVDVMREVADRTGEALGLSRMDALLERQEPGLRMARLQPLFERVMAWLPPLLTRALARQQQAPAAVAPVGPFPMPAQRALCEQMMRRLGFNFDAGRLDVAVHPFTGGVPEDVRLTTRFDESNPLTALASTLHETGHACYQQHLPVEWLGQPLAGPHSASLHEGQALTFERQLAAMPGFWRAVSPLLREHFGDQPAFAADNLLRLTQRVRPGRVRVGADALTYPLHIVLRLQVEQALIDGAIEVADVPALWGERMVALLGVSPDDSFAEGPLQDPHWVQGMFGYFPSYLLGAMVAAQNMATMRRENADFDDRIEQGDWSVVSQWLKSRVWQQGARRNLDDAMHHATGSVLSDAALRQQLESGHDNQH